MAQGTRRLLLTALTIIAVVAPRFTAQPPTAEESINKDRALRQTTRSGNIATKPKWGFFGTIFHLILEQVNDTKSAYNQISDLVTNQFSDDNAVTMKPDPSNNGTTESPKISRAEFLKILDRNLKGLARLRALEWREAKKADSNKYSAEIPSPSVQPSPDIPASPSPDMPANPSPDIPANPSPDIPANPSPDISASPSPDITANPSTSTSDKSQFAVPSSRKRLKKSLPPHITKSIETLQSIKDQALNSREMEDEFYHFGKNIASQLRKLPLLDALDVQSDILNLIKMKRKTIIQRYNENSSSSMKSQHFTIEIPDHMFVLQQEETAAPETNNVLKNEAQNIQDNTIIEQEHQWVY